MRFPLDKQVSSLIETPRWCSKKDTNGQRLNTALRIQKPLWPVARACIALLAASILLESILITTTVLLCR